MGHNELAQPDPIFRVLIVIPLPIRSDRPSLPLYSPMLYAASPFYMPHVGFCSDDNSILYRETEFFSALLGIPFR